jgi:hypothetical protein
MSMLERWRNQMIQGLNQAKKNTPKGVDLTAEFASLEAAINALNLDAEEYNDEDLPVINQIQYRLRFIDIAANIAGIPGGFAKGLNLIYTRTANMVSKIAADAELLEISVIFESICRKAIEAVGPQDPTQFYWQYYQEVKDKPNQFD